MVAAGLFHGEHVELFRGELVTTSPVGCSHSVVVTNLYRFFDRRVAAGSIVRSQQPLVCADDSEPEPDLAIVARGPHLREHPAAAALVIEVAESSREYDLGSRLRFAPEGGDGARMILKIAVKNNDPVTRNVAKSRFNRRVLTKIARKLYATNTAVRRGNIRNHRPGVFGALVIDKDHLVVGTELAAYFGDFLYQHMQAVPAAIYWRDKRNEGHARFNRHSDGFFCKSLARASGVPSVACTQE